MFDSFTVGSCQQQVSIESPLLKLCFHGHGSAIKGVKLFSCGERLLSLLGFIATLESLFLNC